MIAKRAQYGRGKRKPCKKIKTAADLKAVLNYFGDENHEDHVGHLIAPLRFANASEETFEHLIHKLAEAYRRRPVTRGRRWKGEVAEHIIFSPAPGADLSEEEKVSIEKQLVEKAALGAPVAMAWHTGPDGRQHLHAAFGNIIPGHVPRLRVTELRKGGVKDYAAALRAIGREVIEALNKDRAPNRQIETLETVLEKKTGEILQAVVAITKWDDDEADIFAALKCAGWKIRRTKKTLSFARPTDKKPTRFNPSHFFDWLADLHREKAEEKRREQLRARERGGKGAEGRGYI